MAADPRPVVGTFTVNVIRGRDLAAKDKRGTSDPYVVVKVDGSEFRTSVVKKELNPRWNELFSCPVHSNQAVFHLEVWDWDKIGSDDFMGESKLSLSACPELGKYMRMWLHLVPRKSEKVSGDVEVMVKYEPLSPEEAAVKSASRRRRRHVDVAYTFPPPTFLNSLPQVVDPLDEMIVDEPVASALVPNALFTQYLEEPRGERDWYKRFFASHPHDVFVAKVPTMRGAVAVAVLVSAAPHIGLQYWVEVFSTAEVVQYMLEDESETMLSLSQLLARIGDGALAKHAKQFVRVSHQPKVVAALSRIEDPEPDDKIKIGVLFARQGQTNDDEMFSNIDGSPAFEEFLDLIGERVRLKGFEGYSAQLDTSNDGSGLYSVYEPDFRGYKVMYHVSTLLQYDETDPQRVQRKRFIGNDIVVVVFVDGDTIYSVDTMKSQYTRVLIVVQPDPADPGQYRVSTAYARDVRDFGPDSVAYYPKDARFKDFLLAKCINGELATKASPEFVVRERRTRQQYLDMLYDDFSPAGRKDTTLAGEAPGAGSSADGPGGVGSTTMADLEFVPPQVLQFTPLLEGVPGKVAAMEQHEDALFFGAKGGLYKTVIGSADCVKILSLEGVVQIGVDAENDYLFVLTAEPERMLAFTLSALMAGTKPSTSMIPAYQPVLFTTGRVGSDAYISIAIDEAIDVYRIEDTPGRFTKLETLHLPAKVNSITAVARGIVVGASSADSAAFHFFAYPDFAPTVLHTGEPSDTCVRAFSRPRGLLLCYDTCGILLDRTGAVRPESVFRWKAAPLGFAVLGPFLIVYYSTFAAILSAVSGAAVESHLLTIRHPFTNASDAVGVFAPCGTRMTTRRTSTSSARSPMAHPRPTSPTWLPATAATRPTAPSSPSRATPHTAPTCRRSRRQPLSSPPSTRIRTTCSHNRVLLLRQPCLLGHRR
ncbi:RapGAP/RanGAP domain-containing protein [Thecamonas trahens ATCC 50062]|uniref:RapGAP/RanGAP domain-containing protein n=1 Tax=Thecamonas trahens ATCC 50062 TaxID=461836 RepID=A0A0L0D363_THETB|nr:RapGAP/RanGAP domain-containing protein [Thecamonas trahens ATCC 50062]KNC46600.1 RapGAP/RanGAP domain-containing protein [Thecamonas trahens ATCC 50062]|eukprot:XP_013760375.1 RapGAP/RanGAP domain-containing protein [Thecamonas trahens ATCC 50062]